MTQEKKLLRQIAVILVEGIWICKKKYLPSLSVVCCWLSGICNFACLFFWNLQFPLPFSSAA